MPDPSVSLPVAMEWQVTLFQQALQETVQKENYIETDIIAMDEVPLHFLPKGEKPHLSLLINLFCTSHELMNSKTTRFV